MNLQEMKAMEGVEFIYVFQDKDSIPVYIKKFDTETGKLSCWSFSLTTDNGYTFEPLNEDEEREQACCICVGINKKESEKWLKEIKETGRLIHAQSDLPGTFPGCPF
jgi:hypothetical protein